MKENDLIEVEINGVLKRAQVVSILTKDNEHFCLYSVNEHEESSLYVSKIIEENGSTKLIDTNDSEIQNYVLRLISKKVKSIENANKNKREIKKYSQNSFISKDIINASTLENTKVTEKNMEDAINIMREWSEENK